MDGKRGSLCPAEKSDQEISLKFINRREVKLLSLGVFEGSLRLKKNSKFPQQDGLDTFFKITRRMPETES